MLRTFFTLLLVCSLGVGGLSLLGTGSQGSPVPAGLSDRDNPVAYGRQGTIGPFGIRVVEASFGEASTGGIVEVSVRIEVELIGGDRSEPFYLNGGDPRFSIVGDGTNRIETEETDAAFEREGRAMIDGIFPGGSVEFVAVWRIDESDVESAVMYVEAFNASTDALLWMSLYNEGVGTPVAATPRG